MAGAVVVVEASLPEVLTGQRVDADQVTVTLDVPEGGIVIAAADAAQSEGAAALVTVGSGEEGGDDSGEGEEGSDDSGAEEGDDSTTEEETAENTSEELANTGVESGLLAVIAVAVLGAGAMAIGYTRRFA